MSQQHSTLNPFVILGGLASDLTEVISSAGSEVMDIPSQISQGWENGALIDTDSFKASQAYKDLEAEIIAKHEASKSEPQSQQPQVSSPNQTKETDSEW